MPDHPLLGTKVFKEVGGKKTPMYQWTSVKDVVDGCRHFAAGCNSLKILPTVHAEGRDWRFLGIQAKNREEWVMAHWGNMLNGATTVALYETLGEPALRFIINQTEMTTIACSSEIVKGICRMKLEDDKLSGTE